MRLKVGNVVVGLLLFTIPFNFIVIEGIGNIYLSTLVVLLEFLLLFINSEGNIVNKKYSLLALFIFLITVFVTFVNVVVFDPSLMKFQITNTAIYFQVTLTFIIVNYYYRQISLNFIYKLFLIIGFISVVRVIIEEPNHIFKFSIAWKERIESLFIGGVNNFALISGIAFIISFFHIKRNWLKSFLCIVFFTFIVLTMSRGGLFAAILTLFAASLYDKNRNTFRLLVKYSLSIISIGIIVLLLSGKAEIIYNKLLLRFFNLFTHKIDLNTFFSSRGDLISDILTRFSNSSIFQILFGHGNGGIDFYNSASKIYFETSHNIFIDILYKNGLLLLLFYLALLFYILWLFLKNRNKNKLTLFGIFFFIQLELIVNPILFAAQVGWLYAIFMVYFLHQDQLNFNDQNENKAIQ